MDYMRIRKKLLIVEKKLGIKLNKSVPQELEKQVIDIEVEKTPRIMGLTKHELRIKTMIIMACE